MSTPKCVITLNDSLSVTAPLMCLVKAAMRVAVLLNFVTDTFRIRISAYLVTFLFEQSSYPQSIASECLLLIA